MYEEWTDTNRLRSVDNKNAIGLREGSKSTEKGGEKKERERIEEGTMVLRIQPRLNLWLWNRGSN